MRTITIELEKGKQVSISELPIGKYAELIKALKQLPKHIAGMDKLGVDQIFEKLPDVITEALPEFLDILAIATPLKKEELEQFGLKNITKLVLAVVEVNDYKEVYSSIKKAMARPQAQIPT